MNSKLKCTCLACALIITTACHQPQPPRAIAHHQARLKPAPTGQSAPRPAPIEPKPTPIADQYRAAARRIIDATLASNDAYQKLQELCDDIGHRLSGSSQLERAVQWAAESMRGEGQENVQLEPVTVPHWVRGLESLSMVSPRPMPMRMVGLGGSVGTPDDGITAEVIVVADESELDSAGDAAAGKIVLFNNPMPQYDPAHGTGYGTTVRFRTRGATLAAAKGALACLVRSVTATSLRTPHTGAMRYDDAKVKIPAAAVSVEDAELINRLYKRGIPVTVKLTMQAQTLPPAQSANVIGEIRGTTWPDEVVVMGGHIDSWDVGQGANDDGGGCVMAMEALAVLRRLNMIPKRTIRVVLWTNEENGLAGAKQYASDHAHQLPNHVAAIESDSGVFAPLGYGLVCAEKQKEDIAAAQLQDILTLLEPLGATEVQRGDSGADVGPMKSAGVVLMGHRVDMATYFDYHHSPADTLEKIDPRILSQNVAALATVAYVLADMPTRLGQKN